MDTNVFYADSILMTLALSMTTKLTTLSYKLLIATATMAL